MNARLPIADPRVTDSEALPSSIRITALLTCFNRKANTIDCLTRLEVAARKAGVDPVAVLVDDASTDGTVVAVRAQFPWVTVIVGDGTLFWNRGMHRAQALAMERDSDYLLWLNDDTALFPDSLGEMVESEQKLRLAHGKPVMVVGSTADRATGQLTYGGHIAPNRWKPVTYQRVWSPTEPVECHVMNGNVVLIPMPIARAVGNLDPAYAHAMGDTDYALRARAKGFRVFVAPGFIGHCSQNQTSNTYDDESLPLSARWKKMMSRKGLPLRSWGHFTRRHCGWAWPVYFAWPYLKVLAGGLRRVGRGRLQPR